MAGSCEWNRVNEYVNLSCAVCEQRAAAAVATPTAMAGRTATGRTPVRVMPLVLLCAVIMVMLMLVAVKLI